MEHVIVRLIYYMIYNIQPVYSIVIIYNIFAPLCRSTQERPVTVTSKTKVVKVTTAEVAV